MRSLLALSLVASTLVACSLASPTYITADTAPDPADTSASGVTPSSTPAGTPSTGGAAAGSCGADDFDKPDVSKLTACGNGKGHCFDKTKIDMASTLTACPDASEVCVPDEVLGLGGGKLKTCSVAAMNNAAGGCITIELVPEMQKQGGAYLKQDVCDAGQVCAPCVDPLHGNAPTPFCAAEGVHKNACGAATGGATTPAPAAVPCCTTNGKSNGICLAEASIPAANKSDVKQLECATGNMCVPAAMAGGSPVKCDGGIMGKGVCMDKCFNDMMSMAGGIGILDGKGCGATELCIPCSMASMSGGTKVPGCE